MLWIFSEKHKKIYPDKLTPDMSESEKSVIKMIIEVRKKAKKGKKFENKALTLNEKHLLKRYI